MSRPVAITGLGVVTSAGRGEGALADSIRAGRCTLGPDEDLRRLGTRCRLSGRLADVDPQFAELPISSGARDLFGRFSRIGALAAFDALASAAGASPPSLGRVLVATAVGPMAELEACFRDTLGGQRHPRRTHAVTRVTSSFLATFLAEATSAPRGGKVVSCACVSALEALREAFELVASGAEDACLVGAVDEDSPSTWWAFDAQRLLGHAESPEARTRSLSGKAGGFLPAGGAAFFVVEAEEAARTRGRPPHARLAGVTLRSGPSAASLLAFPAAAYRAALEEARAVPGPAIDLVMAHAPPTVADLDELGSLDDVLQVVEARTPVRSHKSLFGYALGAAAAIDVVLGVYQLTRGEVLPNDPGITEPRAARFAAVLQGGLGPPPVGRILKTAYAQGGVAGAVVLDAA
jgi:3-oxoacyl-(acyl-carrier-protein) synthase